MFVTPVWYINVLILISLLIYLLHKYIAMNFNYWEKRQVFYFKPKPFVGNALNLFLFKTNTAEELAKFYNMTKEPFFGAFMSRVPILVVRSPELLKHILVKDFDNFTNRGIVKAQHDLLVSSMLLFSRGQNWKNMRTKNTPMFTSGKIKAMSVLLEDIADEMISYISKNIAENPVLDAKELCARFSTDFIARCAFAINAHSFRTDDPVFMRTLHHLVEFNWRNGLVQLFAFFTNDFLAFFRIKLLDEGSTNFMRQTLWKSIEEREKSNTKGNDFIDLLVELRKDENFCREHNFEGDKVIAQALTLFVAGYETSSSTISFTLYELCQHPHIQHKLRLEIQNALQKTEGKITYDALQEQEMKYLHMVVSETLRKYPVVPVIYRECLNDYKIPGSSVVLENDTIIFIPLLGLHYDPEYFPNPHKFNPERFSDEHVKSIPRFAYLPFGIGPRNCIGGRLGLLVTKFALVKILLQYEVHQCEQTPIPIKFDPKTLPLTADFGLPMTFKKINTAA